MMLAGKEKGRAASMTRPSQQIRKMIPTCLIIFIESLLS